MKLQRLISVGVSARTSKLGGQNVMNSRRFMLTSPAVSRIARWRLPPSLSDLYPRELHDLPALG
jgi:hypothetical protein